MAVVCQQCGAALAVPKVSGPVQCAYCKATTIVDVTPDDDLDEIQIVEVPQPAPQPASIEFDEPTPGKQARAGRLAGCAAVAMLVIGAAGALLFLAIRSEQTGSCSAALSGAPAYWSAVAPGCFVDANGDAVLDVAGLTGDPGETHTPTIADGVTGDILWEAEGYGEDTRLWCLSTRWLLVTQPGFQLDFYDARTGTLLQHVVGRDEVAKTGAGDDCALVETADGSVLSVALGADGSAAERPDACPSASLRRIYDEPPGLVGLTDEGTDILGQNGWLYGLRKRERGTPMLTVSGRGPDGSAWSKELSYAASTFASGIAQGRDTLMVWAAAPMDRDVGVLIGLNPATGEQRYARSQESDSSGHIQFFGFNGRYLIAHWWTGLRAFDPSTGDLVWTVGR